MGSPQMKKPCNNEGEPPLATESGTETAGESYLSYTASHMATDGAGRRGVDAAGGHVRIRTRRARRKGKRDPSAPPPPPPPPLWADVPADILGGVLRFLPCLADRASVRSVCRHWRAAARTHVLPAPLPVLVLPRFMFSCLTSDGRLTGARRAMLTVEAAANDFRILGSYDDWLMTLRSTGPGMETAGECCLVNAFSSNEVVHLPRLRSDSKYSYSRLDVPNSAHPSEDYFQAWLLRSALSASPSSASKYIVAALTDRGCVSGDWLSGLALWQPGMTSWYLCVSAQINSSSGDLVFYQGKLFMVWMYTPDIFAFELREDEHRVSLSCPEHSRINPLIPVESFMPTRCNLVVWRGKLLLFIRFFSCNDLCNRNISNVEVFALDCSTRPCGITQIHNFDGDCIFVQKSGCRSFSPDLHAGVQGDLIYFSDECINNPFPYVYNMRDGTVRRCAPGPPKSYYLGYPVWIFPST